MATVGVPTGRRTAAAGRVVRAFALAALLVQSRPVLAYVDPNAGGWLFQMLMPAFTAIMGAWLLLRRWIAGRLRAIWRRFLSEPRD